MFAICRSLTCSMRYELTMLQFTVMSADHIFHAKYCILFKDANGHGNSLFVYFSMSFWQVTYHPSVQVFRSLVHRQ